MNHGESFALTSPVDETRVLARLTLGPGGPSLDGRPFDPGQHREFRLNFTKVEDGRTFEITEVLQVRNIGATPVTREAHEGNCA